MSSPIKDLQFVLHDVLDFTHHYAKLEPELGLDQATINMVIDEIGKFADGELAPINQAGDAGCELNDGVVTTPPGFKEAYAQYIEGGWAGLCGDPSFGGQGMPESFGFMVEEICCVANMAWTMYPGLSRGALASLSEHADEELKNQFLPKLLTGEWTGTMCLTEPHAGSDVGLSRTRAEAHADGAYRINGTKIFISAGEHDMSENIVHLVLARLPDAPSGTKGISMFVVPKFDVDGTRNAVRCGNIEEKMGIHGNATCELLFEDAKGYLVGEPNKGMRYMFTMMNGARLGVAVQGVSIAQAAFEKASEYAAERLQMRSLTGPKAPDQPADPILVHPDVRRLLMTQRAFIEGGRALVYYIAQLVDISRRGGEGQAEADLKLDFLTPIAKGFLTEIGFESANHALQVFGGHGYIHEHGVEQYVRDLRIALLYEGTTGIQALDLVGRKLLGTQGAGLQVFVKDLQATVEQAKSEFPDQAQTLSDLAEQWVELSMGLGGRAMENADEVGAASTDYLFYSGYLVYAVMWLKIAMAGIGAQDKDYGQSKVDLARFYFDRMLPRAQAHAAALGSGADNLMQVNEQVFVA
ncbi:MAG: acyl-CoA dehydrogenase C-terminal domain-containing protein [Pseudomonadota bacterium]